LYGFSTGVMAPAFTTATTLIRALFAVDKSVAPSALFRPVPAGVFVKLALASLATTTLGGPLYLSSVPGCVTGAAPSDGSSIQVVGVALGSEDTAMRLVPACLAVSLSTVF
jgi:hypothetical protein